MYRLDKILIHISQPEQDMRLLEYVGVLCRIATTQEVHLLHVVPDRGQSPPVKSEPPTPQKLEETGGSHLKGRGSERIETTVTHGAPLIEILQYAVDHDIDLVALSRYDGESPAAAASGLLAERVARKSTCSVLVVPESSSISISRIVAPVRDSECSAAAADVAARISDETKSVLCALNVFPVNSGYARVGTSLEEHTDILRKHAEKDIARLLGAINTEGANIESRCVPDMYSRPGKVILEEVRNQSADLIVIGARGRTGTAGVLLGNVTEKLIYGSPVAVLAVKKKGEQLGLLQALLSLT